MALGYNNNYNELEMIIIVIRPKYISEEIDVISFLTVCALVWILLFIGQFWDFCVKIRNITRNEWQFYVVNIGHFNVLSDTL